MAALDWLALLEDPEGEDFHAGHLPTPAAMGHRNQKPQPESSSGSRDISAAITTTAAQNSRNSGV
ncbi:Hypothetical predicted protein [Pelobates cultripes]|uniref:Uncharacterized protein n=1 Tax=Pelobates cultripes TaxID=61616 RepID=A0AAD1SD41_PELCU|nr:Hypothetical predicted protein [Pelobates cultripes]